MINEINELSLSQNGSLSAKDLRLFLLKNFHNKKYILSCDSRKSVFENDIEYIIKLIEDNTYMIRDMINSVIKYEELKPESLDILHKVNASMGTTYLRLRNLCELLMSKNEAALYKKTKVSLVKYMNEFINTVHNNLPVTVSKNIHLRNNMRSEVLVSVDITRLTHILVNLLVNSIVHSHSENGRVDIIVNNFSNENTVAVSVEDYGIGVDIEKIKSFLNRDNISIFGKNNGLLRSYKGYGLIVCQKLASSMNGKILVSNIKEGGSVFSLILKTDIGEDKDGVVPLRDVLSYGKDLVDTSLIALSLFGAFKNETVYLS
ncbi:MAG: sensor histidine kinase [Monoglobus pectinilyticus]